MDTIESALPEGVPENFPMDYKLQDTLNKAVELLPELWKLAGFPQDAILSYRRALLYNWNLDIATMARIEKEFAVFLLYSGNDASPPNLGSQIEGSFVPRNNIEEAVLLLLLLLRQSALGKVSWDPSVLDHLSFALCISGELRALANEVEELNPGIIKRNERSSTLALCYYGEGDTIAALNLLRILLSNRENGDFNLELLLASKICGENMVSVEEGMKYARKALLVMQGGCSQMLSVANCLLGILLSAQSRLVLSDSERMLKQSEALASLEFANGTMKDKDPYIMFNLCLENAEQRKLNVAVDYAKQLIRLEAGASIKSYVLLARIFSAQKRFLDAETVINVALEQTGKWDQAELLRTKAKLQFAQDDVNSAIETYIHLLAILQVQAKNTGTGEKLLKVWLLFA